MGPIGCLETSVRKYRYSLRNNREERISQLLRGVTQKSLIHDFSVVLSFSLMTHRYILFVKYKLDLVSYFTVLCPSGACMLLAWFRQRDPTKEGYNGPVGVYGLSIGLEEAMMLLKEGAVTEV
jgi:hypothetical protein